MAALSTIALATLAAAATYQGYQSYETNREARHQSREQERAAGRLKADEERNKLQTMMRLQKRRGATSDTGTSPRDTILTSPLGVPGQGQAGAKTLLGL